MPMGSRASRAARFFINGLDTTTEGIDLVAAYRLGLGDFGRWNLTAAYNYNKQKIDKRLNAFGPLAQIPGLVLFGRAGRSSLHQGPAEGQGGAQRATAILAASA